MPPAKPNLDPVILLVFNRPDITRQLIDRLRQVRPPQVLVVADGPRPGQPTDAENCARVRQLIERGIDWPATLRTHYAERNLGLRQRVASGLTWAFTQVDRAIILEDDCLPHPSFFPFCHELLTHYQDDTRVGVIAGSNFQPQPFACGTSYYFSRYNHCWGWATWRRAWKCFDEPMNSWPALRDAGWLHDLFPHPLEAEYWRRTFDEVHQRQVNSWAYAWTFSCWAQNLLTALPRVNLVTNIGIGQAATNTKGILPVQHLLPALEMPLPLTHPTTMARHGPADAFSQQHVFGRAKDPSLRGRLMRLLKKCRRLVPV